MMNCMSLAIAVFVLMAVLVSEEPLASADETVSDPVTFAFVIDTTGSMGEEINSVRDGVKKIIDEEMREIESYIVVPFSDPDVGPPFKSSDKDAVKRYLDGISPDGGKDCPEMAMAGLLQAIRVSKPNSFVFFFSDASAKDYEKYEDVIRRANAKGLKIYMMLTGCCESCSEADHYDAYESIERNAGAKLYRTQKSEVKTFMNYLYTVSTTDLKKLRAPPKTIEEVEEIAEHGIPSTVKPTTTETTITTPSWNLTTVGDLEPGYAVLRSESSRLSLSNHNSLCVVVLSAIALCF